MNRIKWILLQPRRRMFTLPGMLACVCVLPWDRRESVFMLRLTFSDEATAENVYVWRGDGGWGVWRWGWAKFLLDSFSNLPLRQTKSFRQHTARNILQCTYYSRHHWILRLTHEACIEYKELLKALAIWHVGQVCWRSSEHEGAACWQYTVDVHTGKANLGNSVKCFSAGFPSNTRYFE